MKKVQNNTAILNNKKEEVAQVASATFNGMYIVDVIPLSRGIQKETLSYFTAKPISLGDLVIVPLRAKEVPAIVTGLKEATLAKTDVKQSLYGLRKIKTAVAPHFFLPAFITAAKKSAEYFATSTGAIIESLTAQTILNAIAKEGASFPKQKKREENSEHKSMFEAYAFQASLKDRLAAYKGIIREEFAKDHSVLFLTPSIDDIPYIVSELGRGIEEYVRVFHAGLPKRTLLPVWQDISKAEHPIFIIGTGIALSVPRNDMRSIIVERENSWVFKQEHRPFVDIRTFSMHLAQTLNARYIMGATALSIETLYRREQEEFSDFIPPAFRVLSSADTSIVDMKHTHSPLQLTSKTFTLISGELKKTIEEVRAQNQHIFLFAVRRGLYPLTLCSDCGTIVSCASCAAPLVLHKKKQGKETAERIFLCHKCGKTNVITDRCKNCNSWRLAPLGVGAERLEEEIRQLFPTITITRVDKDKTPTRAKAEKAIAKFLDSPGSVLVGTEFALTHLKKKIAVTAAVSIDPLFALPSFRIHERVFHILLSLREKANKKCIIQTRRPELPLFKHVQNGNITDFYKEEKEARETLHYPPFITLIKLTASGTKQAVERDAAVIKKHLHEYTVFVFPAFTSKVRGKYIIHAILKIKRGEWPDKKLRSLLLELPPSIAVNVDPEHLL